MGRWWYRISPVTIALFLIGSLVNLLTYQSVAPIIVALSFFFAIQVFLIFTPLGGKPEEYMFSRVFWVNFMMAGIAAVYANQLADSLQLSSDAAGFYEISTKEIPDLSLERFAILHEGALAIFFWRATYDFFEILGFEKLRYIGISVNITMVALTGIIGIKILRLLFENDYYRFWRLILLMSTCGIFWLYGSLHLRDSFVLLATSFLVYVWIAFLTKPTSVFWVFNVITASTVSFFFLGLLRQEFSFLPFAYIAAALSTCIFRQYRGLASLILLIFFLLGIGVIYLLLVSYFTDYFTTLETAKSIYDDSRLQQVSAGSLGIYFISDQPFPIRAILGSIYLYLFPIPFWMGFQNESAYHLFKSANVIFFYFLFPLLLVAALTLYQNRSARTPAFIFLVSLIIGFTLIVSMTSLENRHLGAFFIPIFVLACLPDLRVNSVKALYKKFLTLMFLGVALVHIAWIVLKYL